MEDLARRGIPRLESMQVRILERIARLENSLLEQVGERDYNWMENAQNAAAAQNGVLMEEKLSKLLEHAGVTSYRFQRVPRDYYDRSFEERRDLLGAASIDHLCKSIVMVNTQAHESITDCSNFKNSKYYVVIVQYTARLNAEKVKQFVYALNDGKFAKKRFNMRLAPEDESYRLTGFAHNAVTPIGMKSQIPIILSDAIPKLEPQFFWLGGGEVDLKLGIDTQEFITMFNPFIADCS